MSKTDDRFGLHGNSTGPLNCNWSKCTSNCTWMMCVCRSAGILFVFIWCQPLNRCRKDVNQREMHPMISSLSVLCLFLNKFCLFLNELKWCFWINQRQNAFRWHCTHKDLLSGAKLNVFNDFFILNRGSIPKFMHCNPMFYLHFTTSTIHFIPFFLTSWRKQLLQILNKSSFT